MRPVFQVGILCGALFFTLRYSAFQGHQRGAPDPRRHGHVPLYLYVRRYSMNKIFLILLILLCCLGCVERRANIVWDYQNGEGNDLLVALIGKESFVGQGESRLYRFTIDDTSVEIILNYAHKTKLEYTKLLEDIAVGKFEAKDGRLPNDVEMKLRRFQSEYKLAQDLLNKLGIVYL